MDNGLPVTPAASLSAQPAARGRLSAVRLRLRDRQHAGAARLQTPRRHRRRHDRGARAARDPENRRSLKLRLSRRRRPLTPRDQAAVIALAARAPRLTAERLDELAALAAAVSGDAGRSGPDVTRRVLGVAQWVWDDVHDAAAVSNRCTRTSGRSSKCRSSACIGRKVDKSVLQLRQYPALASRRSTGARARHLALARARSYPAYMVDRLERVTADAHQLIYQRREFGIARVRNIVAVDFPSAVRTHAHVRGGCRGDVPAADGRDGRAGVFGGRN